MRFFESKNHVILFVFIVIIVQCALFRSRLALLLHLCFASAGSAGHHPSRRTDIASGTLFAFRITSIGRRTITDVANGFTFAKNGILARFASVLHVTPHGTIVTITFQTNHRAAFLALCSHCADDAVGILRRKRADIAVCMKTKLSQRIRVDRRCVGNRHCGIVFAFPLCIFCLKVRNNIAKTTNDLCCKQ